MKASLRQLYEVVRIGQKSIQTLISTESYLWQWLFPCKLRLPPYQPQWRGKEREEEEERERENFIFNITGLYPVRQLSVYMSLSIFSEEVKGY